MREAPGCGFDCGAHWLLLNAGAYGRLDGGPLRDMLQYVSTGAVSEGAVSLVSESVAAANTDREWVSSMRTLEEYWQDQMDYLAEEKLAEGEAKGRAEAVAALMSNMGWTEQEARRALGLTADGGDGE